MGSSHHPFHVHISLHRQIIPVTESTLRRGNNKPLRRVHRCKAELR